MAKELKDALNKADAEGAGSSATATLDPFAEGEQEAPELEEQTSSIEDSASFEPKVNAEELHGKELEKLLGVKRGKAEDDATFMHRLSIEIDAEYREEAEAAYNVGRRLWLIRAEGLYQEENFEEFIAASRVKGWGRSKIMEVLGQIQDFVIGEVEQIPVERLARIGWRKIQEVRGSIREGIVSVEDALADAEALSTRDLARKKQEWKLAAAKAKGLSPDKLKTCQTCARLRKWERKGDEKARSVWLGCVEDNSEGATIRSATELMVDKMVYCDATGRVLAVGTTEINKREAVLRAENCISHEEQF